MFHPPKSDAITSPRVVETATTKGTDEHAVTRVNEKASKATAH